MQCIRLSRRVLRIKHQRRTVRQLSHNKCVVVDKALDFFCPDQGEVAYPTHHLVLETTFRNQGSVSGATMIPQMTVVADLTRGEG